MTTPLDKITVDLRPGGVFETVMVDDASGSEYASRCFYDEIAPPDKLVWTDADNGMVTTTTLVDLGDGRTEMRIHQTSAPSEITTPDRQAGFNSSLDRFESYLARIG
jgi:uncharacterized protein YndB with AHSA1/START domain